MSYTNIVQVIKERAEAYGNREVFRFKEKDEKSYKSYHWNSLVQELDQVSGSLLGMGFGPGSKIGIFSDNRIEWTITDLGIIAICGVVVPFFSTSSKQQVKYIVDETRMELMFVGNSEQVEKAFWLLENCASLKKIIVFEKNCCPADDRFIGWREFCLMANLDDTREKINKISENSDPNDLLTIIYTSGTTGEPKGVMLTHTNYFACFNSHDKRIAVTPKDVSLCFLPLSHVFERTWTFYILYRGAVNAYLENPRNVMQALAEVKPTLMCTVPRFFEKTHEGIIAETGKWPHWKKSLFNWAIAVGKKHSEFKSKNKPAPGILKMQRAFANKLVYTKLQKVFGGKMRYMPCAGSAIRYELLRFFHAAEVNVLVGYGTTETTATIACFRNEAYNFNSVGDVMPGLEVKLSKEGEIMVKGATVFNGYYRKPAETEAVLKEGWYYTGDQGSFNEDGTLVMTDRIKDLFKTSVGKYVSPQKIELLLGEDKYIEQVVCIGDNRKYVTALIVPSFINLQAIAPQFNLRTNSSSHELCNSMEVHAFFTERINKMQEELASYEKVVKFSLIPEAFTIENDTLTSSLKIKRKIIAERYQSAIEAMY